MVKWPIPKQMYGEADTKNSEVDSSAFIYNGMHMKTNERHCYGTFCRPCTICRRRQIAPTLAAHFVAPMHNLTPDDKMCCSGT